METEEKVMMVSPGQKALISHQVYKQATALKKHEALYFRTLEESPLSPADKKTLIEDIRAGRLSLKWWGIRMITHLGSNNRPKIVDEQRTYSFALNTLQTGTITDGYLFVPACVRINVGEIEVPEGEDPPELSKVGDNQIAGIQFRNINLYPQFLNGLLHLTVDNKPLFESLPLVNFDVEAENLGENEISLEKSTLITGKQIIRGHVEMEHSDALPELSWQRTLITGLCAMP